MFGIDINEIILGLIGTIGIPIAIYVIRYLHSKVKNMKFARDTKIDEFIFQTLEDQVVTHMSGIVKAKKAKKGKKVYKDLQVEAKYKTLIYVKQAAKIKGINVAKTYGEDMLAKALHITVKKVKGWYK